MVAHEAPCYWCQFTVMSRGSEPQRSLARILHHWNLFPPARPCSSAHGATAIIQAKVDPLHHLQRRWEHFVPPLDHFPAPWVWGRRAADDSNVFHRSPQACADAAPVRCLFLPGLSLMLCGGGRGGGAEALLAASPPAPFIMCLLPCWFRPTAFILG